MRDSLNPRAARVLRTGLLLSFAVAALVITQCAPAGVDAGSEPAAESEAETDAEANTAGDKDIPPQPFPNRFDAPALDGGKGWLNTSGPISIADLRGKVVLLDFWTYCCINCIHVLPDLKILEEKFAQELVVIGVHSAKFDNEKETENIRQAILRYEIEHPVINDDEMVVWRKYGARSWPTLVLIDPEGKYCGYLSGEGNLEILTEVIGKVIEHHDAKGTLDRTPVRFNLERMSAEKTPLRYPGKLLFDAKSERLFISDSNHNRIVIAKPDGSLEAIIGSGRIGLKDGSYADAQFDHPQGMALVGDTLYVADTENHAIRTVDLKSQTVATLAGDGNQSRRRKFDQPLSDPLNSPWDLLHQDGILYIAMAGPHQIWSHKLGSDEIGVYAGTGREDIIDGPLEESAFAQPSGFAAQDGFFYVADSEGSSIRKVPFDPAGDATTLIGAHDLPRGATLFEFGDKDGVGEAARLQHPLGLAFVGDTLYVADTYNHKLKTIDVKERKVTTWLGDGERGDSLDPLRLSEPAGLASGGDGQTLYVADTNNHRILVVDTKTKAIREFKVDGLKPPAPPKDAAPVGKPGDDIVVDQPQAVPAEGPIRVVIRPQLPEGFKLNKLYPAKFSVRRLDGDVSLAKGVDGSRRKCQIEGDTITCAFPGSAAGTGSIRLTVDVPYCRDGESGLCKMTTLQWRLTLKGETQVAEPVTLKVEIE